MKTLDRILDWLVLTFCNPFHIDPQGNCPVQAEGILPDGAWYYFRARGRGWSLDVSTSEDAWFNGQYLFHAGEKKFIWPHAGWITRREACQLATAAIRQYYRVAEVDTKWIQKAENERKGQQIEGNATN